MPRDTRELGEGESSHVLDLIMCYYCQWGQEEQGHGGIF